MKPIEGVVTGGEMSGRSEWLLTLTETAEILGVSRQTVHREMKAGRLVSVKRVRRCRAEHKFTLQNLIDYLHLYCKPPYSAEAEARVRQKLAA